MKITVKLKLFLPPKTHKQMPMPAIHKFAQNIVSSIPNIIMTKLTSISVFLESKSPANDMKKTPSKAPAYMIVMTRVS